MRRTFAEWSLCQALCYVLQTHEAISSSRDPKRHSLGRELLSPRSVLGVVTDTKATLTGKDALPPPSFPSCRCDSPHFTGERIKVQRGEATRLSCRAEIQTLALLP